MLAPVEPTHHERWTGDENAVDNIENSTPAELLQGATVGPGNAEVLGLARIGEASNACVQQRRAT